MSNRSDEAGRALFLIKELVASTAEPSFAVGVQGEVIAWNQGMEALLNRAADDVVGSACHDVICGRDIFGNRYCDDHCALHSMADRGEPVRSFELVTKSGDGERIPVRLNVMRMKAGDGHVLLHVLQPLGEPQSTTASEQPTAASPIRPPIEELTPRELEVLQLLAGGSSTQDIADSLFIGTTTVRSHVQSIIGKFGAHSKLEAVALAYRLGII